LVGLLTFELDEPLLVLLFNTGRTSLTYISFHH
jgi:hypothetical protein